VTDDILSWAQGVIETILAESRLDGLKLTEITFDPLRQGYRIEVTCHGQIVVLFLPNERFDAMQKDEMFARRKFRKQIEAALGPSPI
jgi:hypothetical protein